MPSNPTKSESTCYPSALMQCLCRLQQHRPHSCGKKIHRAIPSTIVSRPFLEQCEHAEIHAPSSLCSPHTFTYAAGAYAVDEHMQRVSGPRHAVRSLDKIALHHYVLKSREVLPSCDCSIRHAGC